MSIIQSPAATDNLENGFFTFQTGSAERYILRFDDITLVGVPHPTYNYGAFDIRDILKSQLRPTFSTTIIQTGTNVNTYEFELAALVSGSEVHIGAVTSSLLNTVTTDGWLNETAYSIGRNELLTLSFLNLTGAADSISIRTKNAAGGTLQTYTKSVTGDIIQYGLGPKQLNSSTTTFSPTGSLMITSTVVSYDIKMLDNGANDIGTTVTVTIDDCPKGKPARLHWIADSGVYESYTYTMKNREFIQAQREVYKQSDKALGAGGWVDRLGGTAVYDVEVTRRMALVSDWVTDNKYKLLAAAIKSPETYIEWDGEIHKCAVTTNEVEIKRKGNDKLINMELGIEIR